MHQYAAGYLATAFVMIALDLLWLGVIAKSMYQNAIGHLMAEKPNIPAALVFYALYALGLEVFAVIPQSHDPASGRSVLMGALFGFFAYATYDLSNLATLRNWPIRLTIVDIAWGTVLSGVSGAAGSATLIWVG